MPEAAFVSFLYRDTVDSLAENAVNLRACI